MNRITSSQNPLVKEVKALKSKKARDESNSFFIEGIRLVEEALKEDIEIKKIFLSESFLSDKSSDLLISQIEQKKLDTFLLTDNILKDISDTENPQGVLAVLKIRNCSLDIIKGNSFVLLLEAIQDPGNLGTIIRTADAAGADAVVMSKGCVDLYNPKVLRSTMGSVFHIPVCYNLDMEDTIVALKNKGIKVYAAHLSGEKSYVEEDYTKGCTFIIGNEANGITEDSAKKADVLLKIPMPGRAESLNASIAAGVLMYEVVRQRCR
ncbi:MAG: 23S rRNA (guanosine(2251)-2'-O)-methyltransferase RlmB [Bacillota bacterium]|nr:23S rRNA (guanosine(2251)-2'-O)-methyltransferase RlmB [Bacillota bacterium]